MFQAILDAPEDDVPRLVYADWLEENGVNERAEFIRIQCQRQRLPEEAPKRLRLQRGECELFQKHGEEWTPKFAKVIKNYKFRRGFVGEIEMTTAQYVKHGAGMFKRGPTLDRVHLTDVYDPNKLTTCRNLRHVRHLTVERAFGDDFVGQEILNSPHLRELRSLDMRGSGLQIRDFAAGAACPVISSLESLALRVSTSDHSSFFRWLKSPKLKNLQRLSMVLLGPANSSRRLERSLDVLINSPHLEQLEDLHWQVPLGVSCAELIAISSLTQRLRSLSLARCDFSKEGMAPFLDSEGFPNLRQLRLHGGMFSNKRLDKVCSWKAFSSLNYLHLGSFFASGAPSLRKLMQSPDLPNLVGLTLGDTACRRAGIEILLRAPFLHQLHYLDLSWNQLRAQDVEQIGTSERVRNLQWLSVAGNQVSGDVAATVADSNALENLLYLDLRQTNSTTQGIVALSKAPQLSGLYHLRLSTLEGWSHEAYQALANATFADSIVCLELGQQNFRGSANHDLLKERYGDRFYHHASPMY